MNKSFILDACSIIAFLNAEKGGEKLKTLLENNHCQHYMHMINLCETYYGFYKKDGKRHAEEILQKLLLLPIEYIEDISLDFIKAVGKYKAAYKISLADAFVLALAEIKKAAVVTTDHKEFDPVSYEGKIEFLWLR